MEVPLKQAMKIFCILVLMHYGTLASSRGKEKIHQTTSDNFEKLFRRIGGRLVSAKKDTIVEKSTNVSSIINDIDELVHDMKNPDGMPPAIDGQDAVNALENILSTLGPYVCMLPKTKPTSLDEISTMLGGILGGVVGHGLGQSHGGGEQMSSMLSGMGSLAGAMGAMSGGMQTKGRSVDGGVLPYMEHAINNLGNLSPLMDGQLDIAPELERISDTINTNMAKFFNSESKFVENAAKQLQGRKGRSDSHVLDMKFRGIDNQLADLSMKSAGMASFFSGVISAFFPPIEQNVVKSGRIYSLKNNLKRLRSVKKGRSSKERTLFAGTVEEVSKVTTTVGSVVSLVGRMVGEQLKSSEDKERKMFGHSMEDSFTKPKTLEQKRADLRRRLEQIMPIRRKGHFSQNEEMCFRAVSEALSQLGTTHDFGEMKPDTLDFKGPYGEKDASADKVSLRRKLLGDEWNDDWNNPPVRKKIAGALTPEEFSAVIDKDSLKDNAVLRFIDMLAKNQGLESNLLQFVRGKITFSELTTEKRQSVPTAVLAAMKPSLIADISAGGLVDIITSKMAKHNPERLGKFLKSVDDSTLTQALSAVKRSQTNKNEKFKGGNVAKVIVADLIERFEDGAYDKICHFEIGLTDSQIEQITGAFEDSDLFDCLSSNFNHLRKETRKAIADKIVDGDVKETTSATLGQIQKLKAFATLLPSEIYNELTSSEISTLLDAGHFNTLAMHADREYQESVFEAMHSVLDINSQGGQTSIDHLKKLDSFICGVDPMIVEDVVPATIMEEFKSNWTDKCIIEPRKKMWKKQVKCLHIKGQFDVEHSHCMGAMHMKMERKEMMDNFKEARKLIKERPLNEINGVIPIAVLYSLCGFTPSELKNLSYASLSQSLKQVAYNFKLNKQQKRVLLQTLTKGGYKMDSVQALENLGELLSEVTIDDITPSQMDEVLNNRPDIAEKLPKAKKATLMKKLLDEVGIEQVLSSSTRYSRYIPVSSLNGIANLNMSVVADMPWSRAQAVKLVQIYKEMQDITKITADDISKLGNVAKGLTCQDVMHFPVDAMAEVSKAIDEAAGNQISTDLANCIATKFYLALKMHYDYSVNVKQMVGKLIPGNLLLFMPVTIIETIARQKDCHDMVRRVGHANMDILPIGTGEIQTDGLVGLAIKCFEANHGEEPEKGSKGDNKPGMTPRQSGSKSPPSPSGGSKGSSPTKGDSDSSESENMDKSVENPGVPANVGRPDRVSLDNKPGDRMDSSNKMGSSKGMSSSQEMGSSNHQSSSSQKEKSKKKLEKLTDKHVKLLGKLACRLKDSFKMFDNKALIEFAKIFPSCIGQITKESIDILRDLATNYFKDSENLQLKDLQRGASLALLLSPDTIQSMSDANVAEMIQHFPPPMRGLKKKRRSVVGDKASSTLSVKNNLMIELEEDAGMLDLMYNPIDMMSFAKAVAPKVLKHLKTATERKRRSATSDGDTLDLEKLVQLAPAFLAFDQNDFDKISNDDFKTIIPKLGRHMGWSSDQLSIIKGKMDVFGDVSTWSSSLLGDLGNLAVMFNAEDIAKLKNVDGSNIEMLSRANWSTNSLRKALLDRYLASTSKRTGDLKGIELVKLGDTLCGLQGAEVISLSVDAVRFAIPNIGKTTCFEMSKLKDLKALVKKSVYTNLQSPTALQDIGILVAAFTEEEFGQIKPMDASLISPLVFRVIPAATMNSWNEQHFALMGTENGAILLGRKDIFSGLKSMPRNAVFRAAFGSNAGLVASYINMMLNGEKYSMEAYEIMMDRMMNGVGVLFKKVYGAENSPSLHGPGAAYGLIDPNNFIFPPPPDFAAGLAKSDFADMLGDAFLEDTRVVDFLNGAADGNDEILRVMKGDLSLNELDSFAIQSMPPQLFEGMKDSELMSMSANTLGSLLDSDRASRDPSSMTKVLGKLGTNQFEEAMALFNEKMNMDFGGGLPWRPPFAIQKVTVKETMSRIKKIKNDVEAVGKFIELMCPVVAGMAPHMVMKIPYVESKRSKVLDCYGKSYLDLMPPLKKQVVRWATQNLKKGDPIPLPVLDEFMLDVPLFKVRKSLTSAMALKIIDDGLINNLDYFHHNFQPFVKIIMKQLVKDSPTMFDDTTFLDKLGHAQCDIPLKKVKKSMSKASITHLSKYTMFNCRSKQEMLGETLDECFGEQALRLQRCQMFQEEALDFSFQPFPSFSTDFFIQPPDFGRLGLDEFQRTRELASSLFEDKDLSALTPQELKDSAGALGGLTLSDLDLLPASSILDAMSVIKDNSNLNPHQKRKMFKKAQEAGFNLNSGFAALGGLISEVPPEEFLKISPSVILDSFGDLKKKAADFSPSQMTAIMSKLQETSVEDLLKDDLGGFASEIPLKMLDNMQTINLTQVKKQPWERGQAAKILSKYKNSTEDFKLNAEQLSNMGSTVIGLKCSDVMDIPYNEMLESSATIQSATDMSPEMDECTQNKLHFSLQVQKGENYTMNETDPELETTIESLSPDVALFYSPKLVNQTPDALCEKMIAKIGESKVNSLPSGAGDLKRQKLADAAMHCLKRTPGREFTTLEEDDVNMIGRLICDIPAENFVGMSADAFNTVMENVKECSYRLTLKHVENIRELVYENFGEDASQWDDTVLNTIGSMIALMPAKDIENLDEEAFMESYDSLVPPEMGEDVTVYDAVQYDAFYAKARKAVIDQKPAAERRRRSVTPPSYDDMVTLGPANSGWSVEELKAIESTDLINAVDTLGAVKNWSKSQRNVLKEGLTAAQGAMSTWKGDFIASTKHILIDLTASEISEIDISSIDTATALSAVAWTSDQVLALYQRFLKLNSKTEAQLTSEELIGLGKLICGMTAADMMNLQKEIVESALKGIGKQICFSQDQLDALYSLIDISGATATPEASLLKQMGSLAAGMTADEMKRLPISSVSFIDQRAIEVISPVRARDGLTTTQLSAVGYTNAAALMRNGRVYNALSVEQRNTVQTAALGDDAVLVTNETESQSQTTVATKDDADNADNAGAAAPVNTTTKVKVTTTSTTTSEGVTLMPSFWILVCLFFLVVFV